MSRGDAPDPLARLRSLAATPDEQAAYALKLAGNQRNSDVLLAALAVLAEWSAPAARPVLRERYDWYQAGGSRRDAGGVVRIAILRALRPVATREDAPLFVRAATTYEYTYGEAAGDLRAAGLLSLSEVDPEQAGYYAVKLLAGPHTSHMSGEPALTAARVLAGLGQDLPLYARATQDGDSISDVIAECLRGLTALPAALVEELITRYGEVRDEIVLLGLFDLLLQHRDREQFTGFIQTFLAGTAQYDLYHSLVTTLVAGRDPVWLTHLRDFAATERNPRKSAILKESLPPAGKPLG